MSTEKPIDWNKPLEVVYDGNVCEAQFAGEYYGRKWVGFAMNGSCPSFYAFDDYGNDESGFDFAPAYLRNVGAPRVRKVVYTVWFSPIHNRFGYVKPGESIPGDGTPTGVIVNEVEFEFEL